jgi:hypothetical protein
MHYAMQWKQNILQDILKFPLTTRMIWFDRFVTILCTVQLLPAMPDTNCSQLLLFGCHGKHTQYLPAQKWQYFPHVTQ